MTPRSTKWALMTLLFAAVVIVYAPTMDQDFVWDDHVLIEKDTRCKEHVLSCLDLPFFPPSPFVDASPPYYRPIITASFALGGDPHTQHSINIGLHALNALLLFALLGRYGGTTLRCFGGSLVWAMHPRLVEAVAWVSGRTDVLCATFVFGALLLWPEPEQKSRPRLVGVAVLLFLALMTKEVAIAAVIALGIVSRKRRDLWPILIAPLLGYSALRIGVVGLRTMPSTLTAGQRIPTTLEAFGRYAEMLVRVDKPWTARGAIGVVDVPHAILGGVLVLGSVYLLRRYHAKLRIEGVALAIASIFAVAQIVPIGVHGAVTGDRFLYLPLAGLVLATISIRADRPVFAGVLVALGAIEGWVARSTVPIWGDELGLWLTVAERADAKNAGPRGALAGIVRDRAAPELACPLFESARNMLEATNRHATPAFRRNSENLAACWSIIGRYDDSARLYRATLAEYPQSGRVALGLGYAELHRLDFAAASDAFAKAGQLDPVLRPIATKMREDLEVAEHERGALEGTDRSKRARYLETVGRGVEAEREWLAVATDPSMPRPLRLEALSAIVDAGTAKDAKEALDTIDDTNQAPFVGLKLQKAKAIADVTPRLRALAL